MYHKKPDKPDKSLAKWVEEKNSKATPKRGGFWHESKYRPPEDDIKEAEIKQDEPELIIPIPKSVVPSIEDYESTFGKSVYVLKSGLITKSNCFNISTYWFGYFHIRVNW